MLFSKLIPRYIMSSSSKEKVEKSSQMQTGEKRKPDERDTETQTEDNHRPKRIRVIVESEQNNKEIELIMEVLETKIREQEPTESQESSTTATEKRKHVEEDNYSDKEAEQPKTKKSKPTVKLEEATVGKFNNYFIKIVMVLTHFK